MAVKYGPDGSVLLVGGSVPLNIQEAYGISSITIPPDKKVDEVMSQYPTVFDDGSKKWVATNAPSTTNQVISPTGSVTGSVSLPTIGQVGNLAVDTQTQVPSVSQAASAYSNPTAIASYAPSSTGRNSLTYQTPTATSAYQYQGKTPYGSSTMAMQYK
jgi:hypothetical protein